MKSFLDLDNKLDEVKIRIDNINWVLHKWLIQMNVNMWVNEIMGNMYTFKDEQNQIDWIPDKIYEREINFSYREYKIEIYLFWSLKLMFFRILSLAISVFSYYRSKFSIKYERKIGRSTYKNTRSIYQKV